MPFNQKGKTENAEMKIVQNVLTKISYYMYLTISRDLRGLKKHLFHSRSYLSHTADILTFLTTQDVNIVFPSLKKHFSVTLVTMYSTVLQCKKQLSSIELLYNSKSTDTFSFLYTRCRWTLMSLGYSLLI